MMNQEYLGTDIAIDTDGDLLVGPTGDFVLVTEYDCLRRDILDRLNTIPGDLWNHNDWGCQAGKMLGAKDTPLNRALIARHIRMALEAEPRINSESIVIRTQNLTQEEKIFHIEFRPIGSSYPNSLVWGFGVREIAEITS